MLCVHLSQVVYITLSPEKLRMTLANPNGPDENAALSVVGAFARGQT